MCKVPIFVQWIGLSLLSVLVIEPWLLDGYELQCFPELLPMISDTEFYLNSWIGLGGEISGQTDWYHLNMRSPFVHYCYMLETSTLENNTWRHLKLDITCCKKKGSSSVGLLSRSQWPRGLKRRSSAARLLRLWVRIPPGAWMFVVSVVYCQVEVSATDWSPVQRIRTDCGASLCVIKKPRIRGG